MITDCDTAEHTQIMFIQLTFGQCSYILRCMLDQMQIRSIDGNAVSCWAGGPWFFVYRFSPRGSWIRAIHSRLRVLWQHRHHIWSVTSTMHHFSVGNSIVQQFP